MKLVAPPRPKKMVLPVRSMVLEEAIGRAIERFRKHTSLHTNEGAVRVVDRAVDQAGDQAASEEQDVGMCSRHIFGKVCSESIECSGLTSTRGTLLFLWRAFRSFFSIWTLQADLRPSLRLLAIGLSFRLRRCIHT